jgi:hypothetical protein
MVSLLVVNEVLVVLVLSQQQLLLVDLTRPSGISTTTTTSGVDALRCNGCGCLACVNIMSSSWLYAELESAISI